MSEKKILYDNKNLNIVIYHHSHIMENYYYGLYNGNKIIINTKNNYINISKISLENNKIIGEWKRLSKTILFLKKKSDENKINTGDLFDIVIGKKYNHIAGTYAHPLLLKNFMEWCFAIKYAKPNKYLYLVTSIVLNGVKAGIWRSDLKTLSSRYKTPYALNVDIFYVSVSTNLKLLEIEFSKKFKKYNIGGEVYKLQHYDEYKKYLLQYGKGTYYNTNNYNKLKTKKSNKKANVSDDESESDDETEKKSKTSDTEKSDNKSKTKKSTKKKSKTKKN